MEHLSLEIFDIEGTESKYAYLDDNANITITETSEIFASGDVWSHSFNVNVFANAHIFGTSGDIHGSRLHEQINKRRARLWVEGLPMFYGYLKIGDEAEVDANGNIEVSLESGRKTFEQLIEGAKANQVPLMNDVKFGVAFWRKRWSWIGLKLEASVKFVNDKTSSSETLEHKTTIEIGDTDKYITPFHYDGEEETNSVQLYPSMVFPKGKFHNLKTEVDNEPINCLNTDYPYTEDENGTPTYPYCNVALCYQKSGYTVTKEESGQITTYDDYGSEPTAQRGYEYMPANRVNSAPNFFVIYWIRSLMKHIGIHVEENQMMDVEDLRRLFFVNTKCAYKEPKYIRDPRYDWSLGKYTWGNSGSLIPEFFGDLIGGRYIGVQKITDIKECAFKCTAFEHTPWNIGIPGEDPDVPEIESIVISIKDVYGLNEPAKAEYDVRNGFLHDAIATPECFPNVDVSEVINALESGFGIRFLFDKDYQRVRIVLLRNIFNNKDIQNIDCDILEPDAKVENGTRGFRMTYGNTDDTQFYYKGFADLLPHKKELWIDTSDKHDYSHWKLNAQYGDIIDKVTAFDKTCYVTPETGNAYGIKVDKDAKRYDELYPSLHGYAGFMDAEDGDCTGDEETIETINVGFSPAIMNDVNFRAKDENGNTLPPAGQKFALFVDDTMRPRRPDLKDLTAPASYNDADAVYNVNELYRQHGAKSDNKMVSDGIVKPGEFRMASDMYAERSDLKATIKYRYYIPDPENPLNTLLRTAKSDFTNIKIEGHINEGYRLYLQDNFEPNDDGVCPIENHDWGLTLGIMRGSGSDAKVEYSADPDDKGDDYQNDTWEIVPGSSATAHHDICDDYGKIFDYTDNDQDDEQDTTGRFSLKLRAEKLNPYFDPNRPESANNRRYLEIENENLRQRGLCDQFYKEYSYWVRNARIVKRTVRMELAQILSIDKTKRVKVDDVTGFIRKMQYTVSNNTGLGMVTMEIMYI